MRFDERLLRADETAVFVLRALYERAGYARYKMNKFEEYDLYVRNKDFLVSDNIIAFTDPGGKMMALKPDVTLSIVKSGKDGEGIRRVYYNENVYRIPKGARAYREIMQVGLECIGDIDRACIGEVVSLAAESLIALVREGASAVSGEDAPAPTDGNERSLSSATLAVSHMGVLREIMDALAVPESDRAPLLAAIESKNPHEMRRFGGNDALVSLVLSDGSPDAALPLLSALYPSGLSASAEELLAVVETVRAGFSGVRLDLSVVNDLNYYNGIVFQGYVNGVPGSVLSGGQYDSLMQKMGRRARAVGFAVYLDFLERFSASDEDAGERTVLNIALPKGRLGEKVYARFERAGFPCPAIREVNRKLIFENDELSLRYFWVKPSDVAIYVERGAADIGVCGKDILLEYEPEVYELCDLGLGKCRMAVAAKRGFRDDPERTLRVATKFSNIARTHYGQKGRDIDLVPLNGSIEIAPILGLSDVIVDIVETGTTLRENDLTVFEEIVPISARLIANKSSYKFKNERILALLERLDADTEERA